MKSINRKDFDKFSKDHVVEGIKHLKQLEEENTLLKDIEETATRDYNTSKSEYDQKIEELRRTRSSTIPNMIHKRMYLEYVSY